MKRTKILATLGPASSTKEKIKALYDAGANAFRINLSHGKQEQWKSLILHIREVAPTALIVADTRGPELRILNVKKTVLEVGDTYTVHLDPSTKYPYISQRVTVRKGQRILFNDGAISTKAVKITKHTVTVEVEGGGLLTDRRKVTIPEKELELPVLSESDIEDLIFCKKHGADAVALSFTQCKKDVKTCRAVVGDDMMIIAKIENRAGVEHHEEILDACDGVMVARGDLGVEIPLEEVPGVQKTICRSCNHAGKPVIVATQMLESMIKSSTPTRAEVSDVAHAILDGADCVMLSAETAVGKYPLKTVSIMSRIAKQADTRVETTFPHEHKEKLAIDEAISHAVYDMSTYLQIEAIVTATTSGYTTRKVARFRPQVPLIAVTYSQTVFRRLQIVWGVQPCLFMQRGKAGDETIIEAVRSAMKDDLLKNNYNIIATAGIATLEKGTTNLIEVHNVKDLLAYHEQMK